MIVIEKTYDKIFKNKKMYLDYLFEDKFNKYFSIKKGGPLNNKIAEHSHFGLFGDSNFPDEALYIEAETYGVTSKFAFYLECGIPLLVNKRFKTLSTIVENNKIGFTFTDADLTDFKKILNISQKEYDLLLENIHKYRNKFTYNKTTMGPILSLLT